MPLTFTDMRAEPDNPEYIAMLKAMTPKQKLERMAELWEAERQRIASAVRTEHPEFDEPAVWKEVRWRLLSSAD